MAKRSKIDYPAKYEKNHTGPVSPYANILKRRGYEITLEEEETKAKTKKWLLETWNTDEAKLFEIMQTSNVAAGKKLIASCLVNAIQVGDYNQLNTFLNRIVGKVKEEIVLTPGVQDQSPDSARQILLEAIIEPSFKRVE